MKVDIYRLGESDDSWAVFVEGSKVDDLSGLTRDQAQHQARLIVESYLPGSGVVELPDTRESDQRGWTDSGSGPGWSGDWGQHDDPTQEQP